MNMASGGPFRVATAGSSTWRSKLKLGLARLVVVASYLLMGLPSLSSQQFSPNSGLGARLCVTHNDYGECLQLAGVSNGTIGCVSGRDKYECMKHIIDDRADIVNLNNEELYLAGRLYNLEPFAMEQVNGASFHYKSVVVINNRANINSIADLKGKRSCHGSLNSTQGWDIPIGLLLATMTMTPDCRGEIYSASKFFDQSCAPEKLHPNLCSACHNATLCSSSDEFHGDDGTLRCLFSGHGQVAFTTSAAIERLLASDRLDSRILSSYSYLCLDGTKQPLESRACEWAMKPTNVFVTDPNKQHRKDAYLGYLQALFHKFVPYKPSWWHMKSLYSQSSQVTQILAIASHLQRWDKYLGNYISSIEKPLPGCESNNITFCTSSSSEELKCLDLQKAAFSIRIRPDIHCKRRPSKLDCLELVAKRQADLVAVDLGQLYESPNNIIQALEPVAVAEPQQADYAVAVVRADSNTKFLYNLMGKRSCHAHFGDSASWLAPLSVLSERSLLDSSQCNKAEQMAEFFGGSCVPGAADLRVNRYRSGAERLCALCRGDPSGAHQCERSQSERYFGQAGALRCLVEGSGEVAFVSLSSLVANVDGKSQELWARNAPLALDSRNFKLVCRNGPSMLLGDYERCHLSKLPGKVIVSTKFTSREDRLANRHLLAMLVDKFGRRSKSSQMFDLFAPFQNESDLMFDDATDRIIPLQLEMSKFELMARQHLDPAYQQMALLQARRGSGGAAAASSCKLVMAGHAESSRPSHCFITLAITIVTIATSCLASVAGDAMCARQFRRSN